MSDDAPLNVRPVRVDEATGRLYEVDGTPVEGIDPDGILAGLADIREGRARPLREIVAERRARAEG